jgi:hypothetical protein
LLPSALRDPFLFAKALWPWVYFYDKQREIIESFRDNRTTVVPAGNKLGKDFVSGFLVLWFFLTRHPCRIVTTSVDGKQLEAVLWGEIRRFIQSAQSPLDAAFGGPLIVNHLHLRKMHQGKECGVSYVLGRVAAQGEGLQGHHVTPQTIEEANDGIPRTACFFDEASGLSQEDWEMATTWSNREMVIGNCWPCENFFKYAVEGNPGTEDKGGDLLRLHGLGYTRKVINIKAEDSPNVQLGLKQELLGIEPTNEILVPGVKSYFEYLENRRDWDEAKQCVSLDARWYKGQGNLLYPAPWLDRAERRAEELRGIKRTAKAMGVDSAEGGDQTVWVVIDEYGVIFLRCEKTPDTSVVPNITRALMREYNIPAEKVYFDRGGGGYEHVCLMRSRGEKVKSIGFGEPVSLDLKYGMHTLHNRKEVKEERYAYKNRRAEMYGQLRVELDPEGDCAKSLKRTFCVPRKYSELRRQLAPIPLWYDDEGRMFLPPKHRASNSSNKKQITMDTLIGCSPDQADALVLAIHALKSRVTQTTASAA